MTGAVELSALLRGTRRLWWLVSVFVLLGGSWGYLLSTGMPKVYEATTTVLVGETLRSTNVQIDDVKASQSAALTYGDIVRRQPVLEGVITALNLPTTWLKLRDSVRVDLASNNAQLIVVTVEAPSPGEAKAIAAEIGSQLLALSPEQDTTQTQKFVLDQLAALQGKIQDGQARVPGLQGDLTNAKPSDADAIRLRIDVLERMISAWQDNYASLSALMPNRGAPTSLEILEDAYASPDPVRPRPRVDALLGAGIAGMLAVAIVYVAELRRRAVRRPARWRAHIKQWARLRRRRGNPDELPPEDGPDIAVPQVEVAVPERGVVASIKQWARLRRRRGNPDELPPVDGPDNAVPQVEVAVPEQGVVASIKQWARLRRRRGNPDELPPVDGPDNAVPQVEVAVPEQGVVASPRI